jgi:uncharacterized protein YkwD
LTTLILAGSASAIGNAVPAVAAAGTEQADAKLRSLALAGHRSALRVLAAPVGTCVGADDQSAGISQQEAAMKCLVNYARAEAGLPRLESTRKLDSSAAGKAGDILRCDQFSHSACGRDFLYWFRRSGYLSSRCWSAGENLAWGTGNLGTARSMVKAWLRSPSHRANILGGNYSQFGISLRIGSLSGNGGARVWVNHFGRRC